ncbi:hypothetical protein DUI87_25674 [Hirundo rustica rustica]|uniref:Uncharacterized protein n=1 Tax=Hirundo rustica rustica TaxID=333673 RepID=A0A3M0J9F8_HIRRU|nr:hypothetical protein DUI87_25674 [Hirundo rustica rustica]
MEQGSSWVHEEYLFGTGAEMEGLGGIRQGGNLLLPLLLGVVAASGVAKLRGRDGARGQRCPSDCQTLLQSWDTSEVTGDRPWGATAVSWCTQGSPEPASDVLGIIRIRDSPRCAGDHQDQEQPQMCWGSPGPGTAPDVLGITRTRVRSSPRCVGDHQDQAEPQMCWGSPGPGLGAAPDVFGITRTRQNPRCAGDHQDQG